MKLDFSAIQNLTQTRKAAKTPPEASQGILAKMQPPAPEIGKRAASLLEQEQRNREREREVYRAYQENIKRAADLRAKISGGLKSGGDLAEIVLHALECISRMTGDTVFYEQGKEDLIAIYGLGLRQPAALKHKLEEVKARLAMLTRPELAERLTDPEERKRIERAAAAHRALVEDLERELQAAP